MAKAAHSDHQEPMGFEESTRRVRGHEPLGRAPLRPEPQDRPFEISEPPQRDPERAGGFLAFIAAVLALCWAVGAISLAIGVYGFDQIVDLSAPLQIGLGFAALIPAFLILFAGAAAREGARARAQAARLADAADRLANPSPAAEASARRLGVSVRGEVAALERAIDQALYKAREMETLVAKQSLAMDGAADAARHGAEQMLAGFERERNALLQIAHDLSDQANLVGDAISRHARAIAEASHAAEEQIRGADDALESRLSSFGASAALIAERTVALNGAAKNSAEAAQRLDKTLCGALDALSKATSLTDAARQSAETATMAANSAAGAVRETTQRAVEETKRAAEMIRAEVASINRMPAAAPPAPIPAPTPASAFTPPPAIKPEPAPVAAQPPAPRHEPADAFADPFADLPAADRWESDHPRDPRPSTEDRRPITAGEPGWTWRDVLAQIDDVPPPAPSRAAAPSIPAPQAPIMRPMHDLHHPVPAAALIEQAGVRLGEVFNLSSLDRIAQRSRGGTQARRRAVREAAPDALNRVADLLRRDRRAQQVAIEFLQDDGVRIAELLGRGRASMSADATRAFLLIDSVAG